MNTHEVRTSFLNFYEKRLKLELLRAELRGLRQSASAAVVSEPTRSHEEVPPVTFDLQVLEMVLADTYSITANRTELHRLLAQIRSNARFCNTKIQMILGVVHMPLSDRTEKIRDHNAVMRIICETLKGSCDSAISELDAFLAE